MNVEIKIKPFARLSLRELYDVMVVRNLVFVVGQEITSEPEIDGLDPQCHHVIMRVDGEVVGTTRIFMAKEPVKIGRVCVLDEYRRQGLGKRMMLAVQAGINGKAAVLNAQAYLEDWYADMGWKRRGDVFDEAGIPHVKMVWGEISES